MVERPSPSYLFLLEGDEDTVVTGIDIKQQRPPHEEFTELIHWTPPRTKVTMRINVYFCCSLKLDVKNLI